MTPVRARSLAKSIIWASGKFGIEPLLYAAIIRQESNFVPDIKLCYVVRRHHVDVPTCDYGLSQVNQVQVDRWGLDAERLVYDEAYNLFYGAKVLAALKRKYAATEPNWWSRFNSANPTPRAIYETALQPFLMARAELFQ